MHRELLEAESGYSPYKVDFSLVEKNRDDTPGELLALWFIFDNADLGPAPSAAPDPTAADPKGS